METQFMWLTLEARLLILMTSLAGLFDCDWKHADDKFGQ